MELLAFDFPGAMIYYATDSIWIAIVCSLVNTFIIFKLADWTAPAVEHFFGLPGISLPHGETVNFAPLTYALNRLWDKIPGINKSISMQKSKRTFGYFWRTDDDRVGPRCWYGFTGRI